MVLSLLYAGGEKAVTFGAVAAGAGLAASSLVQRHGSVAGMIRDARAHAWAGRQARLLALDATLPPNAKGAVALLKALAEAGMPDPSEAADPALAPLAADWRAGVEGALAARLGGGAKGAELAAILFAAWAGQMAWSAAGGRGFRLKEALRRLGG